MDAKPKALFVVDIEGRGDDMIRHGILSIGVCIGLANEVNVLHKQRFDLKPLTYVEYDDLDGSKKETDSIVRLQTFEPRCLQEFWLNEERCPGGKAKKELMEKNGKPPLEQIRAFRALFDQWDTTHHLFVLSDNAVYDLGWINYYLSLANAPNLSHRADGSYMATYDTHDYARGARRLTYDTWWTSVREIIEVYKLPLDPEDHDHMPENDAAFIYHMHMGLMLKLQETDISLSEKIVDAMTLCAN
jgi:hypothetical protein